MSAEWSVASFSESILFCDSDEKDGMQYTVL